MARSIGRQSYSCGSRVRQPLLMPQELRSPGVRPSHLQCPPRSEINQWPLESDSIIRVSSHMSAICTAASS